MGYTIWPHAAVENADRPAGDRSSAHKDWRQRNKLPIEEYMCRTITVRRDLEQVMLVLTRKQLRTRWCGKIGYVPRTILS